jgi:hypothetical protein
LIRDYITYKLYDKIKKGRQNVMRPFKWLNAYSADCHVFCFCFYLWWDAGWKSYFPSKNSHTELQYCFHVNLFGLTLTVHQLVQCSFSPEEEFTASFKIRTHNLYITINKYKLINPVYFPVDMTILYFCRYLHCLKSVLKCVLWIWIF